MYWWVNFSVKSCRRFVNVKLGDYFQPIVSDVPPRLWFWRYVVLDWRFAVLEIYWTEGRTCRCGRNFKPPTLPVPLTRNIETFANNPRAFWNTLYGSSQLEVIVHFWNMVYRTIRRRDCSRKSKWISWKKVDFKSRFHTLATLLSSLHYTIILPMIRREANGIECRIHRTAAWSKQLENVCIE